MNTYRDKLAEMLARKRKENEDWNSPEQAGARADDQASYSEAANTRSLASALSQASAGMGTIGGKSAKTGMVQEMGKSLNAQDRDDQDAKKQERGEREKRFGLDLDVVKYLAGDEQKADDRQTATDRWNTEQDYKKTRDKKDDDYRDKKLLIDQNKANAKGAGGSYQQRLSNLGGEERKRLDSAMMGFIAVQGMTKALVTNNDNTFSMVGDNDYTLNRSDFEEALGRMQSGGAINSDEEARFRGMAPKVTDTKEMQQTKLKKLLAEMGTRVQNLGFYPEEMLENRYVASLPEEKPEPGTANAATPAIKESEIPEALKWANENPDDPRAQKIKARYDGYGGGGQSPKMR